MFVLCVRVLLRVPAVHHHLLPCSSTPQTPKTNTQPPNKKKQGNIFDLGAAESAARYEEGGVSFAATRDKLLPRPWVRFVCVW